MNKKVILILVPLNIANYEETKVVEKDQYVKNFFEIVDKARSDAEWIKSRINVFMKYTYRSLINQTNQNFTACIIYDDKSEQTVCHEVNKYCELPKNIRFISKDKIDLFIKEKITDSEYVYFARIDSDDMCHKSYVQKLFDYTPLTENEVIINKYGYLYDSINNRLAVFDSKVTSCYTIIYKTQDYLDNKVPSVITEKLEHQMGAVWNMENKQCLEGLNYIWHIHSKNILSCFEEWYTNTWINNLGEIIQDRCKIEEVLREFKL